MVKSETHRDVYGHSFEYVTRSIWQKYEGHETIQEVDVLERKIDEKGRLHSKRLLVARGMLPSFLQPLIDADHFLVMETTMVDPKEGKMTVETQNISMTTLFSANGLSSYTRTPQNKCTNYEMTMKVSAHGLYFSGMLEDWLTPRLAGNAKQGQDVVNRICERLAKEKHNNQFQEVML